MTATGHSGLSSGSRKTSRHGQSERSNPVAPTSHIPLQTDTKGTPQFGLIARSRKVNPALVLPDKKETLQCGYDQVTRCCSMSFSKSTRRRRRAWHGQEQGATIARLQKQIETLTVGLQKVSAQLELK